MVDSPFQQVVALMPQHLRCALKQLPQEKRERAEEIRLRQGFLPTVLDGDGEQDVGELVVTGELLRQVEAAAPDLVLVCTGLNDVAHRVDLGAFRRDCRDMVQKLAAQYPAAQIWVGTITVGKPSQGPWYLDPATLGDRADYAINDYYGGLAYYKPLEPTVKKELHPDFPIVDQTQENLIHCVLHARRLLTLHEGLRWFDVKRYGIVVNRRFISNSGRVSLTDELKTDDLRRAIQIPSDVISAGMKPNPRN